MTQQPDEGPAAEVERLRQELRTRPDDNELRSRLARAIRRMIEESLAVTVYQVRMIASQRQRDVCRRGAAEILELAPWDGELQGFATGIAAEVERGERWAWQPKAAAATLAACAILVGLALVVVGGLVDNLVLIVVAGVLSSACLAGVVLAFRRQVWQLAVRDAQSVIAHPGI